MEKFGEAGMAGKTLRATAQINSFVEELLPKLQHEKLWAMSVAGYLATSPDDLTLWRLYLTKDLDEWVEFADEDVVHFKEHEGDPLGRMTVWLRPDTPVDHILPDDFDSAAAFLTGDISALIPAAAAEIIKSMGGATTIMRRCRRGERKSVVSTGGCSSQPVCGIPCYG